VYQLHRGRSMSPSALRGMPSAPTSRTTRSRPPWRRHAPSSSRAQEGALKLLHAQRAAPGWPLAPAIRTVEMEGTTATTSVMFLDVLVQFRIAMMHAAALPDAAWRPPLPPRHGARMNSTASRTLYGIWPSPISAATVAAGASPLTQLALGSAMGTTCTGWPGAPARRAATPCCASAARVSMN